MKTSRDEFWETPRQPLIEGWWYGLIGVSEHSRLQLDKVQSRALWSDRAPPRSRRGKNSFCIIGVWHRLTLQCKELWDGDGFQLWMPRLTTLKKAPLCQSVPHFIPSSHYNFSCSSVCRQTSRHSLQPQTLAFCTVLASGVRSTGLGARCLGSNSCQLCFLGIQFWFWTVYFQFWGAVRPSMFCMWAILKPTF